jgi:hypothetical protein
MARTNIPLSPLAANTKTDDPAGTAADEVNNHVITGAPPERILLRVVNGQGAATTTLDVKAGANPPAASAGQGDYQRVIPAATTEWFGPFESARFMQVDDGTDAEGLWIDISEDTTVTITAFEVPVSF